MVGWVSAVPIAARGVQVKDNPISSLSRLRYVLGGALVLIVLANLALSYFVESVRLGDTVALFTSIGGAAATLLSIMLGRSIARYPGVEASAYLLPSFFIGYGVLLAGFVLSRLSYNRTLLIADFVLTLGWTLGVKAVAKRRPVKIGIVPEGRYASLLRAPLIQPVLLDPSQNHCLQGIDAVAADLQHDLAPDWERALADCALKGIPVYHSKHLLESLTGKVELQHLSENSFGMLTPVNVFMTIKHAIDWLVALIFLALVSPVLFMTAVAIRLDSPGPAIFRQERIGYRGRPFTVYKFRTMKITQGDPACLIDAAKTRDRDNRITRLGAFLRRTRIDELPQVLNILRGEMSWIGPRPEARVLSEWYESELTFYRYRHIVRPGITGWAQVNQGHVAEISDVQEKLYYDFFYIKHYSFWIDVLIIARTVLTVFTGTGAR